MTVLKIITHSDCEQYYPVSGHPECPQRLEAALAGIDQLDEFRRFDGMPAARDQLARVHAMPYLIELERIERRIYSTHEVVALDADTHAGPGSIAAARVAAGSVCQAVEMSIEEPSDPVFAVVRPPGHHAEPVHAMGFCFYNSIAVGAAHALEQPGIARLAICDFDVHHGNGTETMFGGSRNVLFASSHQFPLYPGSGDPHRPAPANILNIGLPPGSGSNEFRNAWKQHLLDPIDRFAPDMILVSAGFDAHWRDPLAQLDLKDEDFFWIGHELKKLADRHARGRLVASLEGGYDLQALTDCVLAFSEGITLTH
ncbi:MAG: histone deacetylase family protein [Wenzhouxiangellaceae bacterium]|nr:histone deacetylase family protein [Wenzhouxiangellaceae bacterium]